LRCSKTALDPNASCSVTVAYAPTTPGKTSSAKLTATSNRDTVTASLTLTGTCAQPVVLSWSPTTSPGTYNYGTVSAGQTVSQVFTLTNLSGKATTALTVTLAGPAAFTKTKDSCTGHTLAAVAPGNRCGVLVTYAPTASGQTDSATLAATSSTPADNASLTLTGTGGKAAPAISTSPGAGGAVGTTVTDTAALSGGASPGGTVEFQLYGPSTAADCSAAPVDDETVNVSGNGSYTTPEGAAPSQAGTYLWTASSNLYWTNFQNGTLWETGLDGSNPHVIAGPQTGPAGVAVNGSNLYGADAGGPPGTGTINEASLDGSNAQVIVSGLTGPGAVAVDSSHLYWTDANGTITQASLDGTNPQTIITGTGRSWVAVGPQ
jgi:hypothetical protein